MAASDAPGRCTCEEEGSHADARTRSTHKIWLPPLVSCRPGIQSHWEWHVHSSSPLMNHLVHLHFGIRARPRVAAFPYNPLGMISLPQVTRAARGRRGVEKTRTHRKKGEGLSGIMFIYRWTRSTRRASEARRWPKGRALLRIREAWFLAGPKVYKCRR